MSDFEANGAGRRGKGYGRVRRTSLELGMGPEPDPHIVLHDSVVEHARLRDGIQAHGEETDPPGRDLGLHERGTEKVLPAFRSPFHDPPRLDFEPRANNRAAREEDRIRRVDLAAPGPGT